MWIGPDTAADLEHGALSIPSASSNAAIRRAAVSRPRLR